MKCKCGCELRVLYTPMVELKKYGLFYVGEYKKERVMSAYCSVCHDALTINLDEEHMIKYAEKELERIIGERNNPIEKPKEKKYTWVLNKEKYLDWCIQNQFIPNNRYIDNDWNCFVADRFTGEVREAICDKVEVE